MSNDPIKTLTDTLTLLRVEIADVKKRQITEERLKHLEAALEDNAAMVEKVSEFAAIGGQQGTERMLHHLNGAIRDVKSNTENAIQSLSDARRSIQRSFITQKDTVRLLLLFSAFSGVMLGALLGVVIVEYQNIRSFKDSIQSFTADLSCELAGGTVAKQDADRFCWFRLPE